MAGEADVEFDVLQVPQGVPQPAWEEEPIARKGADGDYSQIVGRKGDPFAIVTYARFTSQALAAAAIKTTYPGYTSGSKKKLATVTDHEGGTWSNVILGKPRCDLPDYSPTVAGGAHSGNFLVRAVWPARITT